MNKLQLQFERQQLQASAGLRQKRRHTCCSLMRSLHWVTRGAPGLGLAMVRHVDKALVHK